MLKDLTIKRKLMAILMLTSAVAVLCAGIAMSIFDLSEHRRQMVDELTMLAEVTGHNCRAPLAFDVPEDARTMLAALAAKPSIVYACVYEAGGDTFATYGLRDLGEEAPPPDLLEEGHQFDGGYLRVFHQIKLGGEIVGTVYLQGDMREIHENMRRDAAVLALVVLLAIVVAWVLAARLQRLISGPILAVADLADAVSRNHDYAVRGKKEQDDEVGLLVDAFNEMLAQIQQREEALRHGEARYRAIVEDQTELICRYLPDCTLTFVNDAYCRYFGRSSEELVGNKFLPLIPPEDRPEVEAHFASLTHDAPVGTHEHRVLAPDGEIHWHQWTNRAIFDKAGKLTEFQGAGRDITERKLAEEALRRSEARNRAMLEAMPDLMFRLTREGTHIDFHAPDSHELYAVPKSIIGRSVADLLPAEVARKYMEHIERTFEIKAMEVFEYELGFSDVDTRFFEARMVLCGEDTVLTVVRNITERKQAEEEMQRERDFSDALVRTSPTFFAAIGADGRMKMMNEAMLTALDYRAEEVEGKHYLRNFVPEADRDMLSAIFARMIHARESAVVENRVLTKDGRELLVEWHGRPIVDRDGKVDFFIGVGIDITDRKRAEEEMQRLRLLLKNMIDSMPSSLVAVDGEGRVTHWNRRAEETTGVSLEEAEGQPLGKVFPAMEAQLAQVREAIRQREAKSAEKIESFTDGERHFSDVMVYPLVTNGVDGAVIRVDDVTERVHLEEMMIQSEKMLSVGGLAAGMAHEINNPLSGILQSIQVVLDRISADLPANVDAARDCGISLAALSAYLEQRKITSLLESVRTSGQRAARIVENMLSFSRKGSAEASPHDLGELLDKTVDLAGSDYDLKKKYDFKQIEIIREYASDLPDVPCEATKIQQVFLNLLKNGAQAMAEQEDRSATPRFVLRAVREGETVRIEVEDNGPGMSEEVRKRLFEPFFTTKEVGAGTGLGLSVSYFIVTENHRGTMSVESSPGAGAKFIIRLPLERSR